MLVLMPSTIWFRVFNYPCFGFVNLQVQPLVMHKMICFSILLTWYNGLMAQDSTGQLVCKEILQIRHFTHYIPFAGLPASSAQRNISPLFYKPYFKGLATQFIKPASTGNSFFLKANPAVPQDHYTIHSGWVCRQEWKLEKFTGLPFRLRLGSKEQVDWLEGKSFHR